VAAAAEVVVARAAGNSVVSGITVVETVGVMLFSDAGLEVHPATSSIQESVRARHPERRREELFVFMYTSDKEKWYYFIKMSIYTSLYLNRRDIPACLM
jgi:hypothetical protein